jgi:hypothetical protein
MGWSAAFTEPTGRLLEVEEAKGRIHLRRPPCGIFKFRLRPSGGTYIPVASHRSSLNNLADSGVRRLLNGVKQLVTFDGQIEVWAHGFSFANAFSHPHVQLRNVERKPCRDRGRNPAIALRYREVRQRFARLRAVHSEHGDLYVSRLARICRHDSKGALGPVDFEQEACRCRL